MKKNLLLLTFAFGLGSSAWAGPCGVSSLDTYLGSTFSCSIGDITFSDFSYGSLLIPASSVLVTPETVGSEKGFLFNAPWFAPPGTILDSAITYTATCNDGCSLNDWEVILAGISLPPTDAFVSVGETSPQVAAGLSAGANNSGQTLSDSATFSPVGTMTVNKDLIVSGGSPNTSGITTHVSFLTNLFSTTSTVPEPSLLLLCAGLVGTVPVARRRLSRKA